MDKRDLIVGAGSTGLTAAVALAHRGLVPTVIERRPDPWNLSRTVGILPCSMRILAPSGAAAAIEAKAVRFDGLILHRGARPVARMPMNFDAGSRLWGLAQDRTEAHLATALHRFGCGIRSGVAFRGLLQDGDRVEVETSEGTAAWDHVIGADGAPGAVRQALGIGYPGMDLPQPWSIADVEAEGWADPTFFKGVLLPHGAVAVVVPLAPARFRVIASARDALAARPVPLRVTRIRRSGSFNISIRQAERYRRGAVSEAGDAAQCHSPVGGRG